MNRFKKIPVIPDVLFLIFIFILFILIRSMNYSLHINFSFDQADAGIKIMDMWKNSEITLVGPGNSIIVNGKQMIQGSLNYYFPMIFFVLGKFDPIHSSYIFMLFTALMIIPLFFGIKWLFNRQVAIFITILYCLLPVYIDSTRFFFGPNFQLSLLPVVTLFMGLYKKFGDNRFFFMIFFSLGVICQIHFATLFILLLLSAYYLISERKNIRKFVLATLGFIIGFSPIIIFELKNNFYNIRILAEYWQLSRSAKNFELTPHRYINSLLILIVLSAHLYKKYVNKKTILITLFFLLIVDTFLYFPKPSHAYGMNENWNFPMERKAYEIIRGQNIKKYNIVNHIYDNLSIVIKYQMKRDGVIIDFEDYYHNDFLFVISNNENIFNDPAYEIKTFQPNRKIKEWKLNNRYNLYLFERIR
ncbi:hypothetical protein A3J15_00320 [Candidatus Roizmanbacteria bacterium RIFCSPLOWO2_02_FULL_38_10]|uniref:Glycosyltransferase RgtA/B/C/D-like domain-containing protein n=1 Tax=Candidatus Roizmanbacteria bacterium RIFCSPLOWO2_02_FULL_38_10 TaxID=1802074 RepID=A0A1F7JK76_9BACT|nr:MAG: hypothetical protein A3J15_00320 [Candidatus Roizmanbacteria bacterium RIFCSPLOWO2_02_FULL_38_10]